MGKGYKRIQISLILGLLLTIMSVISDYNVDEYNLMKEDNSFAAFGKLLLAISANQDQQNNEYKMFMHDSMSLLDKYTELNNKMQFWVLTRNIFIILGVFFNVLALIWIAMKEEKNQL